LTVAIHILPGCYVYSYRFCIVCLFRLIHVINLTSEYNSYPLFVLCSIGIILFADYGTKIPRICIDMHYACTDTATSAVNFYRAAWNADAV